MAPTASAISMYDTLVKHPVLVESELEQTMVASGRTVDRALEWLLAQFGPAGPILVQQDLTLVHKTAWALFRTGRHSEVRRVLDWIAETAVQASGDICLPAPTGDPDGMRLYRQSWVMRTAVATHHALAANSATRERMLSYQDDATGAVFGYIGEDATARAPSGDLAIPATCAFGQYALAAGLLDHARRAGEWVVSVVEQNRPYVANGRFYYKTSRGADLDTATEGVSIFSKAVCALPSMQPTWVLGIATAFLADLSQALRAVDGTSDRASRYLAAAVEISAFQDRMPLETYFSWNACKVAWGSGRLLSALITLESDDIPAIDAAYRSGRRCYMYTLAGTQGGSGGWSHELPAFAPDTPEATVDYRTIEGVSAVPAVVTWDTYTGGSTVPAHPVEITAENLYLTEHYRDGLGTLRSALPALGSRLSEYRAAPS